MSASSEDYLEAILNLQQGGEAARSKDIAAALSVSRASVTGALRLLKEKRLVNYEPYGCITLTESGRRVALEVVRKHNVLTSFFTHVLGVKKDTAQRVACRAEHAFGRETISRLLRFIEFVTVSSRNGRDLSGEFWQFCQNQPTSTRRWQRRLW